MKGLRFLGKRTVELRELPNPVAKDDKVVVKIKASAICGSDLPNYRANSDILGCVPGHELAGVVFEVDKACKVKIGDRVALNTQIGCGICRYCRVGQVLFCKSLKIMGYTAGFNGGHAEYVSIPEKDCLSLPDDIGFDIGAVIPDGVGVAHHLLNRMGLRAKESVAVFGCGPIGIGMITLLKFWGAYVVGVDVNEYRCELASKLGADIVINANEEEPVGTIMKITEGDGAAKTIDCVGETDITLNQALSSVRAGGKVGFLGVKSRVIINDFYNLVSTRELEIFGSCGYNLSEFDNIISLIRSGLPVEKMITHRFPLKKADEAYRLFDQGKTGKVVLIQE
ncbi:MAG: alcohol dehydrogenase catalytic domain-containing protein [Actinobacteria bacterium]|nr:alcohol dehydrogenase catalytic domain-containing protein [Actinomycetota bacterium]